MFAAFVTLNSDGDNSTPISLKARRYLDQQKTLQSKVSTTEILRITSLRKPIAGILDYQKWLDRYLNVLPQNPFEALMYDTILVKVFYVQYHEHHELKSKTNPDDRHTNDSSLKTVWQHYHIRLMGTLFYRIILLIPTV